LLDTGKSVEVQTLKLAFDNALNQVLERNTEFAAFHLEENAKKASNPSDKTAAREAGQVALKRFLNKDSLRRLNETPLEEWSTSDIRYARTLIAF
jgi:hypothetical protein